MRTQRRCHRAFMRVLLPQALPSRPPAIPGQWPAFCHLNPETLPMDANEQIYSLQRRAQAAREYTVPVTDKPEPNGGPAPVLEMRLPTQHESDVIGLRAGMGQRLPEADAQFRRLMLEHACIGWSGITSAHVLADAGAEPLPWSPRAVTLVLDAQSEWENRLWRDLVERLAERVAQRESAEKNSNAASPG